MTDEAASRRGPLSAFREFFDGEAAGGLVLVGAALLALAMANSPLASGYFSTLATELGPLSVTHWINDALMALFFLLVGVEIKREMLEGELASWRRRALPGIAALGGMAAPAMICVFFTLRQREALRGWAVPSATDIAFAVAAISVFGSRLPTSLRVFLTALAIIDDLGAVVIIALFYASGLSWLDLALALVVLGALMVLNRRGVVTLWPYLILGALLWVFVYRSGLHSTLAGVALAMSLPLRATGQASPLQRVRHALAKAVPFAIVPIFGFANAGVSFAGLTPASFLHPLTLGVGLGLVVGKPVGVLLSSAAAIRAGLAEFPSGAGRVQFLGVAQLCGIGFTMSLFIALLGFAGNASLQADAKLGILAGSVVSALIGLAILTTSTRRR